MKRKICAAFMAVFILISTGVSADVIWQNEESRVITKGIVHRYIEKFTDAGWDKINILEVDLTDTDLSLTALYDKNGIKNLKTVTKLAGESGAAVAVNADFFNFSPTSPLGFTVDAGEMISSPSHDIGLAALVENAEGNIFMDYFSMQLYAVAPDGNRAQIVHINKYHSMDSIVMFTKGWGATSPGSQEGVIELVAENGIVTEIRENLPGAAIPENGFVLATSPAANTFFKDNFAIGDEIKIELSISPDYGEVRTAVGGGTVLVSEGEVFKFTNDVSGSHPRTAAGINEAGDKLYLVTVEGRQTGVPGMTQTQLARLMIEIGSYTAINLDGGGSSTMVAKNREGQLETLNTLSGGSERSVSTALGVIQNHPSGGLAGFDVMLSSPAVFKGDRVEVWVTPYDAYYNKYTMNGEKIEYTSSGGGEFDGHIYYPVRAGKDSIMVMANGAKGTAQLQVLDKAVQMNVSPQTVSLAAGQSQSIYVTGKDENGYEAYVSPKKIKWTVESGNAEIKDGNIISADGGSAVIKLTVDDAVSYVLINAYKTEEKQIYDFSDRDSFAAYPSYVGGAYEKGLLTYDFTNENTENTKAAYLVFDNKISLENISKIGMTVTAEANLHWLRGQVDMPDGSVQRITFASSVDWTGEKYVEAQIPSELQGGVLTRIYLVQNDKTLCDSGSIKLSDMRANMSVPQNTEYLKDQYTDNMNGQVEKADFAILPALLDEKTMMDVHMNGQIKKNLSLTGQMYAYGKHTGNAKLIEGFSLTEQKENVFITIDNSKNGIRATDSTQWHKLIGAADGIKADNVFVMLTEDCASFKDTAEKELFENILTQHFFEKGKNVFVIYPSSAPSVTVKNGVRYMAVTKTPKVRAQSFADDLKNAVYLCFKISDNGVIYEYKPVTSWKI